MEMRLKPNKENIFKASKVQISLITWEVERYYYKNEKKDNYRKSPIPNHSAAHTKQSHSS